eukprot:sb/3469371/
MTSLCDVISVMLFDVTNPPSPDFPTHQVYEDVCARQRSCSSVPFVRDLLYSYTYEQGCTVEYQPKTPSMTLYKPIRQACYSVVLGTNASVTENCAGISTETVPCGELRGRVDLAAASGDEKKWGVFVECLGVTFSAALAAELPTQFLGLCCILNYWYHSDHMDLQTWEVDALIAQAVSQYAKDVPSIQRILVTVVNPRAITLSAVCTWCRGCTADRLYNWSPPRTPPSPSLL